MKQAGNNILVFRFTIVEKQAGIRSIDVINNFFFIQKKGSDKKQTEMVKEKIALINRENIV